MPIATELAVTQTTDATLLANTVFGDGVTIVSSTLTGAVGQSGIYSGGETTSPGTVPGDSGIIFSTGNVADYTNSDGTTNTNTAPGTTTDHSGAGDADLTALSGNTTFDAVVFETVFIPDNAFLTMQFTFSSEEYLEFVNGGVNDAVGVWVNGVFSPLTPTGDTVSIDTVNTTVNSNLYVDNSAATDLFNTEMDGFTVTLSFKAPVNVGVENTIKIALADGGDGAFDSNLLIAADSAQTVALAFSDEIELAPNSSAVIDVLANDFDAAGLGLTVTKINGTDVVVGNVVTLGTGEQVTLNPDGTLTVLSDADIMSSAFTYEVTDANGVTDVGYVTINTVASPNPDGYVDGSAGGDLIDASYTGDPNGDLVDNNDALGVQGTFGDGDVIRGFGGNDTILAGAGNDIVDGGDGNDIVWGGDGDDSILGGTGTDTLSGNAGTDTIDGGDGADSIHGGQGGDSIAGGGDADFILGDGQWYTPSDFASVTNGTATNLTIINSADGPIELWWIDGSGIQQFYATIQPGDTYVQPTFEDHNWLLRDADGYYLELIEGAPNQTVNYGVEGLNDSIVGGDNPDTIYGQFGDDTIDGGDGADLIYGGSGNDSIFGGQRDDTIFGGTGSDTINVGGGADLAYGEAGDDLLIDSTVAGTAATLYGGDGNDTIQSGTGNASAEYYGDAGDDRFEDRGGTNQTFSGGADRDTYVVLNGIGNDTVIGGETVTTGTDFDTIDLSALATGVTVTYTGDEAGTITDGTNTLTFSQIEQIILTNQADTVDASASTVGVTLTGLDGDDSIIGSSGADELSGDIGDDTISGGAGNDSLFGNGGADSLSGDDGDDRLWGGGGTDTLSGGAGNDTLLGEMGNDTITGGEGDDSLVGGDDSDTFLLANAFGNDTVIGGETITTGTDFDTIDLSAVTTSVTVNFSGGEAGTIDDDASTDVISFSEIERLILTDQADIVNGGGGNEVIEAGGGDDTVSTGTGDDSILGGAGNDNLTGGDGNDTVDGGAGDDYVAAFTGNDLLLGGDGNDEIFSLGGGTDTLDGGADADLISVMTMSGAIVTGGETMTTGSDADTLNASTGVDVILTTTGGESGTITDGTSTITYSEIEAVRLGSGNDTVEAGTETAALDIDAGAGDDLFSAGSTSGDNIFDGQGGNDTIFGGSGNETLGGGSGNDSISGGAGDDNISGGGDADTLLGGLGNDTIDGVQGDDLIFGGDGDDLILGGEGADTMTGGAGADVMVGGGDADTFLLADGFGNDTIGGGDTATTGANYDTINLNGLSNPVSVVFTGAGAGTITDSVTGDTISFSGIEQLILTEGNDTVDATLDNGSTYIQTRGGDDFIQGSPGNDIYDDEIFGPDGQGNDTFIGGDGNDELWGGTGNDSLVGGLGADSIDGQSGDDIIDGGAGNDSLQGGVGNDSILGGDGDDLIDDRQPFGTLVNDADTVTGSTGFDAFLFDGDPGTSARIILDDGSGTANDGDIELDLVTVSSTGDGANLTLQGFTYGTDNVFLSEQWASLSTTKIASGHHQVTVTYDNGNSQTFDILHDNGTAFDPAQVFYTYAGNDTLIGDAGNDTINGAFGNDSITGGTGTDLVNAGAGDDTIGLGDNHGADTIAGGEDADGTDRDVLDIYENGTGQGATVLYTGNEAGTVEFDGTPGVVSTFSEIEVMDGTNEADSIDASITTDGVEVYSNWGDDTVIGGSGADTIYGGLGADSLTGGGGADLIDGQEGNDTILGGQGNDTLIGGDGQNYLDGGAGDDSLVGNATGLGSFTQMEGGAGADTIDGSAGDWDIASYFTSVDGVTVDLSDGLTESGGDAQGDLLIGIEQIDGSNVANDTIIADDSGLLIKGWGGDDSLVGGAGNDTLEGGDGNDTVAGGDGGDTILLGSGNDSATGEAGNDTIAGGDGNDTLAGGSGNDTLSGGTGDDSLFGGTFADTLDGGDGDDTLDGGLGADILTGGADADTFVLTDGYGNDTITGGETITTGTDFDTIDVSAVTTDTTVTLSATEAGTITDGTSTASFSEIEAVTLGGGRDTLMLGTGSGSLTLTSFDLTDSGDGSTRDQLDVSGLTSDGFTPVHAGDVVVTDTNGDGSGDAILTFPGGESLTLVGVSAASVSDIDTLVAMGIPDARDFIVEGTAGADLIDTGYIGDPEGDRVDSLDNGAGTNDDVIDAGTGNDTVLAGLGDDLVYGWTGDDSLSGDDGNDTLFGQDGNDTLIGGAGDDSLDGDDGLTGMDSISGGAGNDTIIGDGGNDTLLGGADDDMIFAGADDDSVEGGTGNDQIFGEGGNDFLDGGAGGDTILGGDGNDTIIGFEGNDSVEGGAGDDVINTRTSPGTGMPDEGYGTVGDPLYYPGDTAPLNDRDTVDGGLGNDSILTGDDNDIIFGGEGNDTVDAGFDDDLVSGGAGMDFLEGNEGNDTIDGGDDDDIIYGDVAPTNPDYPFFAPYDLPNDGTDLAPDNNADSLTGGAGNDSIYGQDDNDTLEGGLGNDLLDGGNDNDYLDGAEGADTLIGGAGNDTLLGGNDASADSLDGGAGNDELSAGDGNDTLIGGDGNDSLFGGGDNDLLEGGTGGDTLDGWAGNDTLTGGLGNDQLTGSDGTDTFVYVAGDGVDTITDFNFGNTGTLNDADITNNDRLDLSAFYDDIWELTADFNDDGILNQSNDGLGGADYSDNASFGSGGLVILGATGNKTSFTVENTGVVCFASGTRILTTDGDRRIDMLQAGDRIVTRDNGVQTLRWIGQRQLDAVDLARTPRLRPIQLSPALTGGDAPLIVSPQHGVLFTLDGEETLVRATHLARMQGGAARVMHGCRSVTYFHLLFEDHQIVFANGAPSESFFPGAFAMAALHSEVRSEIFALFPDLRMQDAETAYGRQARDIARLGRLPDHLKALKARPHQRIVPSAGIVAQARTAQTVSLHTAAS